MLAPTQRRAFAHARTLAAMREVTRSFWLFGSWLFWVWVFGGLEGLAV